MGGEETVVGEVVVDHIRQARGQRQCDGNKAGGKKADGEMAGEKRTSDGRVGDE